MASGAVSVNSWLLDWFNQEGILSQSDAEQFFTSPDKQRQFRDFLETVPLAWPSGEPAARASIAAGSGVDLSGSMGSCAHAGCLIADVDRLIGRTWHYFDRVVVAGPSSLMLSSVWDHDVNHGIKRVAYYAEMLRHIRDIGADGLIVMSQKPPACEQHLVQHAAEAGMADLVEDEDRWVDRLLPQAVCDVQWQGEHSDCARSHWRYRLEHPALEHTRWGAVHAPQEAEAGDVIRLALAETYRDHLANLITDVQYAREAESALGAVAAVHEDILQERSAVTPSETDVAFELPLPVLDGVSSKQLLTLREDHAESFEVFRSALRLAITERLKVAGDEPRDAMSIAIEIAEDVIGPALAKVENQMRASEKLLSRSAGLTVGVSVIATTVGLLLQAPIVIGPLLGAAVAGVDLKKYWADRRDVEISDMYFLWRLAAAHGARHH